MLLLLLSTLTRPALFAAGLVALPIAAGVMLMTFPGIRQLGTTLLASAGVVGLMIGMAARPLFANLILADEINRATPKTQSALLEAMQERTVTVANRSYPLEPPFMVLATQNPIEMEGTYPLPEAQLDRFLFKVLVGYPAPEDERKVLEYHLAESFPRPQRLASVEELADLEAVVREVYLDERIRSYIVALVTASRRPDDVGLGDLVPLLGFGASPRASIALAVGSRALALVRGRSYVSPEDVKELAPAVLRHRLVLTYEAEAEGATVEEIIDRLLLAVEVP
jgi:MoxR-like ATPase